jgi:NADP-dependent 3-hydroxy acid dehydrogenase YdfG
MSAAAAKACSDVEILINNAGVMLATPVLSENSEDALRREMEVNVFGMLAMAKTLRKTYRSPFSLRLPSRWRVSLPSYGMP